MDDFDRLARAVLEAVAPLHADALLARVEVDRDLHRRDLRLRIGGERLVFLLVVGLPFLLVVGRRVGVEDVGVPEDEAAERRHRDRADGGDRRDGRREAPAGERKPALPVVGRAADPEQIAGYRQKQRRRRPIRLEDAHARQERAEAVHVRIRDVGRDAIFVEIVLEAQQRRERNHEEIDDHREMAEVFLVDHRMHGQRQHADEPVVDELDAEEPMDVETKLVMVIALGGLDAHSGQHQHRLQHHRHQHQRTELGREWQPGGDRQRVVDLVQPVLALAPDELPGIERDDHQHEHAERAGDELQHLVGDGPRRRAEEAAGRRARRDEEQHPRQGDDAEVDVLHRLAEVEPDHPRQQAPRAGRLGI